MRALVGRLLRFLIASRLVLTWPIGVALGVSGVVALMLARASPADPNRAADSAALSGTVDGEAPFPPSTNVPSWPCSGVIAEEAARDVLGRHGSAVFACSPRGLEPTVVELYLKVDQFGRPSELNLQGALATNPEFAECVRRTVASWRFDAPREGECAIVYAPFLLGGP